MFSPESVLRTALPNGLTVLIRRDATAPVAAVVTYVKAGYFDETDDVSGIAHVLEHMFFKGTPTRGIGEIARERACSERLVRDAEKGKATPVEALAEIGDVVSGQRASRVEADLVEHAAEVDEAADFGVRTAQTRDSGHLRGTI